MKSYLSLAFLLLFLSSFSAAQEKALLYAEGEILVQLFPNVPVKNFIQKYQAKSKENPQIKFVKTLVPRLNIHLLEFDSQQWNTEWIYEYLSAQDEVENVQFNYFVEDRNTIPDDPDFELQWDMDIIELAAVWDVTTGGNTALGDEIVVAVLETKGFQLDHEDLAENIWTNWNETPDDSIDNDENGYIDDVSGWNFDDESNTHPKGYHGTSVMGIIGAKGNNNQGVSGVSWDVKMLPVTVGSKVSGILAGYNYVLEMRKQYNDSNGTEGAFIVTTNASLGIRGGQPEDYPMWCAMYDALGEVGILNVGATDNREIDVDELGDIPSGCSSDYLLTITNTTIEDEKYKRSGYGAISIDIGSPGQNSYTTDINNKYGDFDGNSAAAPHASGAIGLLYSTPCKAFAEAARDEPAETALFVKDAILYGTVPLESLEGITVTEGRLNVYNSLLLIQELCGNLTREMDIINLYPNPVISTESAVSVEYQPPIDTDYVIKIYNVLGQLLHVQEESSTRFLVKSIHFETNNWLPGMYIFTLGKGDDLVARRFIVL
ncbi:MAG: S8 family serine peptidase [Bacteroidetes bacterium]|nr:S8 family serine peptidase [Bacteroidota bacterium]